MRPVDQTTFGKGDAPGPERGDCLRAAIASLLELGRDEVPHFVAEDEWVGAMTTWLHERGLHPEFVALTEDYQPPVAHVLFGPSPRGDWQHAVAVDADGTVHDPHPSRDGLADGERKAILFLALDPARA